MTNGQFNVETRSLTHISLIALYFRWLRDGKFFFSHSPILSLFFDIKTFFSDMPEKIIRMNFDAWFRYQRQKWRRWLGDGGSATTAIKAHWTFMCALRATLHGWLIMVSDTHFENLIFFWMRILDILKIKIHVEIFFCLSSLSRQLSVCLAVNFFIMILQNN